MSFELQILWNRVIDNREDEAIRSEVSKLTKEEAVALHPMIIKTFDIKRNAGCFDPFNRLLFGVGCYLSHMIVSGKIRDDITPDKIDIAFDQLQVSQNLRAKIMGDLLVDE